MRKKLLLALSLLAVVGAIAATTASASGPTIVDSGFACSVYDGNGNLFSTNNSTLTVYDSGKVVLKCNGNGAGAPSLTFFNFANTGVPCNVGPYGLTNDWSNKVGYNGNSQLTCTTFINTDVAAASAGGGYGIG